MRLSAVALVFFLALTAQAADISGRVTRSDTGEAVAGAVMIIRGTTFSSVSDAAGGYSITGIPSGNFGLSCSAPGLLGVSTGAVWIGDATVRDFALSPPSGPGTVQGTITCGSVACPAALVQVLEGTNVRGEAISRPATGEYALLGLAAGSYRLRALKVGYLPASADITVPEPATDGGTVTVQQNLDLPAGGSYTVSGVVGLSDNPLDRSGSTVQLNGSTPLLSAATASGGSYRLEGVPAGPLSFTAAHVGYRSATRIDVLISGDQQLNFVLQKEGGTPVDPTYAVSGTVSLVLDGGTQAAAGARVRVWKQDGSVARQTASGDDGRYRLDGLEPGEYRAGAALEGYLEQVTEPFSLTADRTQNFALEPDAAYDWGPGAQGPGPGCGCASAGIAPAALAGLLVTVLLVERRKKK